MIETSYNIILASGSAARKNMLRSAGIDFTVMPADIDEAEVQNNMYGEKASDIASALARAKAKHVAAQREDVIVIGSDQVLECGGQIFTKAGTIEEAREKLKTLRGKTHILHSAVSINGDWVHTDSADLTMHDFDDAFLESYLQNAGDILTSCVGAYAIEGIGVQLFEKIEGDYFTILGMPLLPLLNKLREMST